MGFTGKILYVLYNIFRNFFSHHEFVTTRNDIKTTLHDISFCIIASFLYFREIFYISCNKIFMKIFI